MHSNIYPKFKSIPRTSPQMCWDLAAEAGRLTVHLSRKSVFSEWVMGAALTPQSQQMLQLKMVSVCVCARVFLQEKAYQPFTAHTTGCFPKRQSDKPSAILFSPITAFRIMQHTHLSSLTVPSRAIIICQAELSLWTFSLQRGTKPPKLTDSQLLTSDAQTQSFFTSAECPPQSSQLTLLFLSPSQPCWILYSWCSLQL
jgi:hypothetical protein